MFYDFGLYDLLCKRKDMETSIDRSTQINAQRNKSRNLQRTQQKQTESHRCERCNSKLKDQSARLGWICAEIMRTTQSLNRAGKCFMGH